MAKMYSRVIWSHVRGWPVYGVIEDGALVYRYVDTDEICGNEERPCRRCGRLPTAEGEDACLGHIPGANGACCGHGIEDPCVLDENGVMHQMAGLYPQYDNAYAIKAGLRHQGITPLKGAMNEVQAHYDNILILGTTEGETFYVCAPESEFETEIPYMEVEGEKQTCPAVYEKSLLADRLNKLSEIFGRRALERRALEKIPLKQYSEETRGEIEDMVRDAFTFRLPTVPEAALICELRDLYCQNEETDWFWTSDMHFGMIPMAMSSFRILPRNCFTTDLNKLRGVFLCPVSHPEYLDIMDGLLKEYEQEHFHAVSGDGEPPIVKGGD